MNIYDYEVTTNDGKTIKLDEYKGKVLLIVNTATHCGFTKTYDDLEKTYLKYKDKGFEILDFPCNQFKEQAPESDKEINSFCTLNYSTTFPRFKKIDVNGEEASPLYKYLTSLYEFKGFGKHVLSPILNKLIKTENNDKDPHTIKWNFTKFLVNRDGKVTERIEPTQNFKYIDKKIEELL